MPTRFWKKEVAEGEGKKIPKTSVLYLHRTGTRYRCKDCLMFISDTQRCTIHGEGDLIKAEGYCTYWVKGKPQTQSDHHKPMGSVSKLESGYGEDPKGTQCQNCEYFLPDASDCRVVDKDSAGDDVGKIHPMACCSNQEPRD